MRWMGFAIGLQALTSGCRADLCADMGRWLHADPPPDQTYGPNIAFEVTAPSLPSQCSLDGELQLWRGSTQVPLLELTSAGTSIRAQPAEVTIETSGAHRLVYAYEDRDGPKEESWSYEILGSCDLLNEGGLGMSALTLAASLLPAHDDDYHLTATWPGFIALDDVAFDVRDGDEVVEGIIELDPTRSALFRASTPWRAGASYDATFSWNCGGDPYTRELTFLAPPDCPAMSEALALRADDGTLSLSYDSDVLREYGRLDQVTIQTWQSSDPCWDPTCVVNTGSSMGSVSSDGPISQALATSPGANGAAFASYVCYGSTFPGPQVWWRGAADAGPVADPATLVGRVFAADGGHFRVIEPTGKVQWPLESAMHMRWLPMIEVAGFSAGALDVSMVWASQHWADPRQVPCTGPMELPQATLGNPDLAIGPADLEVLTAIGSTTVRDLEIDATLASDGLALRDVAFEGVFDVTGLALEAGYSSASEMCTISAEDGFPCQSCDSGAECLPIRMEGVTAHALESPEVGEACDLGSGTLFVWSYQEELILTSSPGATAVSAYTFEGTPAWTVTFDDIPFSVGRMALQGTGSPNESLRVLNAEQPTPYPYCDVNLETQGKVCPFEVSPGTPDVDLDWDCSTTSHRFPRTPWPTLATAAVIAATLRRVSRAGRGKGGA